MIFIFFLAAATIGGLLGVDLSPRRRDDDDDGRLLAQKQRHRYQQRHQFGEALSSSSSSSSSSTTQATARSPDALVESKQVEPELAFHTEEEIASVIAAALEGDEKKTSDERNMRRRRENDNNNNNNNNNNEEVSSSSSSSRRAKEEPMMGKREADDDDDGGGKENEGVDADEAEANGERISIGSATAADGGPGGSSEDKDDQEDEAEEQSQAEEASRAWDLSTYLNVQANSENSAESLVALIASVGGDERELERYVKVVEPIDPSQWPVNIDKAMYALKSIFRLKARAAEAAQMEAKLGNFVNEDEIEDGIATRRMRRRRNLMKADEEEIEGGKLGYFQMGKFVNDVIKGKVSEQSNEDDEEEEDDQDYDEKATSGSSSTQSMGASLGDEKEKSLSSFDDLETSSLGYFDFKSFIDDMLSNHPEKKTIDSDDGEGISYLGTGDNEDEKETKKKQKLPSLGYFDFKKFVEDAMSEAPKPKYERKFMDSENDSSGVYLDAAAGSTLGEAQQPKLGKVIEDTSETIESLKPLGLTADDVKVLYKAYKKEKKEKESLQDNSEKSGNKVSALIEDDDEEMTLAKEWNLNNLRGMGWFEALVDRDKETGKLSSKWWQTEKIPELGKLFSHVYRWQLAKDAKNEKALILDADGLLDTSNLAIPMDAIRVISAHASNDFDVMFLGNLGTKDPIFETFPDSSGNVIEIRKWQGTQDATNANAYIVSAQFVNNIFDFILSSDMNVPKESLENWLGRVVCGAKEQQQPQQQDDLEENSSLGLESAVNEELSEENTLAKKPVVGKHVFNCYSAAGVQVKPTASSSDAASKRQRKQQQQQRSTAATADVVDGLESVSSSEEKGGTDVHRAVA